MQEVRGFVNAFTQCSESKSELCLAKLMIGPFNVQRVPLDDFRSRNTVRNKSPSAGPK